MDNIKRKNLFSDQIVVKDGMAVYTFSVVNNGTSVCLKLAYLETDDFSWSAYEQSVTTRQDIGMPDNVIEEARRELTRRILII